MPYYGPRTASDGHKRDSQRQRVYNAEAAVPLGKSLPTVPEMQAYTNKLLDSAWARRRWGRVQVKVQPGYGHRKATGGSGEVQMPLHSRIERDLLHEIGHNLAGAAAWHDETFVRVVLELYTHVLGTDVGKTFRAACREQRVRVGPPLKLRSPERTPAPVIRLTKKVWRIEFSATGKPKRQVSTEATSLRGALAMIGHYMRDGDTGVRVWRGRATTKTTTLKAASRRKT